MFAREWSIILTSALLSLALTPFAAWLAVRLEMLDRPDPRKLHSSPTPLLGGLAIYLAFVLSLGLFLPGTAWKEALVVIGCATLLLVTGSLDDQGLLHPQVKLMGVMPLAALILTFSGIRIVSWPFSSYLSEPVHGLFSLLLTVFWVVGITAAFSILDHMDGLCAGVAAIASAFFLLFGLLQEQVLVSCLAAAVLGGALGFLKWNFKPAKIFMGDGGAMVLGFVLATFGIKIGFQSQATHWVLPVLVLGVPIFDTGLIIFSRLRRGLLPFSSPGKDHTAHRLANLQLGQRGAVLSLYGAGTAFGLTSMAIRGISSAGAYIWLLVLFVFSLLLVLFLERLPFEDQDPLMSESSQEQPDP
jgi:UDP-GlcNAc:undecaprenyl-phosphate GlcNAc-1-phosphate transferase